MKSPFVLLVLVFSTTLLFIFPFSGYSQEEVHFEEGLAAPGTAFYQRGAVYQDLIAYQLYKDEFETPEEGKSIGENHEGVNTIWKRVKADEDGLFRGRALSSGYLYLTYHSEEEKVMWLHATGHSMAYFNEEPRNGDIYSYGYVFNPIKIKEGRNEILLRSSRFSPRRGISVKLVEPKKKVGFLEGDLTLPHILTGEKDLLWGGVRVINSTSKSVGPYKIKSVIAGKEVVTDIPAIPAMTVRKVPFQIDPSAVKEEGQTGVDLTLISQNRTIDGIAVEVDAVDSSTPHNRTFISQLDGSVQYYSVTPQSEKTEERPALFLSVHGAEVEAISQARAYKSKDWGVLVAPTNRRPRGFNWEDWGRMDAMEVLGIAKERYQPDPQRIYLTGHSMGGHGTWFLGATYPGHWAAIAPAAGYPTLNLYGSHDGRIPDAEERSSVQEMLLRASNNSDVFELKHNYKAHGVYILHGDADRVVPVRFARMMRQTLGEFHPDFTYYEYPGGSHWYGDISVDWPPLFDFFKQRKLQESTEPDDILFSTANPAVSSDFRWATVEQQKQSMVYSRFNLNRDVEEKTIHGVTENISMLSMDLSKFSQGDNVTFNLDDQQLTYKVKNPSQRLYLSNSNGVWEAGQALTPKEKGAHRNGPFKEAFQHRMVFVYGTSGNNEENAWSYNKARFDAESWYYLSNGSVELISDKEFEPEIYRDRNVILYGNKDINSAWAILLDDSPIQVSRNGISAGNHQLKGDDLSTYFLRPRKDSDKASVAVVAGTGMPGLKSTFSNHYFSGGSGFPDFIIFQSNMLVEGERGVLMTGFFDNDWSLASRDYILSTDEYSMSD